MGSSVQPQLWNLITQIAPKYNLDPRAVAAVSIMEGGGRFGAVGDSGSSFGPWQLHVGGALPAGKGAAWANSRAGVIYALSRMGSVAGGLQGRRAIAAIVNRFERPAQPQPEIAGAWARYQQLHPGAAMPGGGQQPGQGSGRTPGLGRAMSKQAMLSQQLINFATSGDVNAAPTTGPYAGILQQMNQSVMTAKTPRQKASGPGVGPVSGVARTALTAAKHMIGTPYVWGGESPKGFDCSGLVQWAFAKAGISVARTTQQQIQQGRPVSWGNFHPGDLIFSNFEGGKGASHVVIYLGNGRIATHTGSTVQIEDVNAFAQSCRREALL
jgi:cell wall-associated NlpC family hydrolase